MQHLVSAWESSCTSRPSMTKWRIVRSSPTRDPTVATCSPTNTAGRSSSAAPRSSAPWLRTVCSDGRRMSCAMAAAVSNISLYLRRYSHLDDTMLIVPPASGPSGPALARATADSVACVVGGPTTTGYRPVRRIELDCNNGRKMNSWYDNKMPSERPVHATNHNLTIPL